METQGSTNNEGYVREFFNISNSAARIIADPRCEPVDSVKRNLTGVILTGVISLLMLVSVIGRPNVYMLVGTGFCLGVFYMMLMLYLRTIKALKITKGIPGGKVLQFDSESVSAVCDTHILKSFWREIQCVRVYKYTMVFVPKTVRGAMIVSPIENLGMTLAFMRENGIQMNLVRPAGTPEPGKTAEPSESAEPTKPAEPSESADPAQPAESTEPAAPEA